MYHKEIDVAAIMREIRKQIDVKDSLGLGQLTDEPGWENLRELNRYLEDSREWIDEKRSEARPLLEMGMRIPAFMMISPFFRKACVFIARLIRKATLHITREQTTVNRRLDECIAELAKSDQMMTKYILQVMQANMAKNAADIAKSNAEMAKNNAEIAKNNADLIANLREEIVRLQSKTAELSRVGAGSANRVSDELYVAFENKFRGNPDDIKWRLRNYIAPYFDRYIQHKEQAVILDIGCGRGEWLSVLRENQYQAIGIDNNEVMVAVCEAQGLQVLCRDAIYYLQQAKDSSIQAITLFQVAEHLSADEILTVLKESQRVLAPGGFILMETPNAHNVEVGTINFYIDPTHVRPLHTEYLRFLAEVAGFKTNEIFYWQDAEVKNWYKTLLPEGDIEKVDSVLVKQMAETLRKNFYSSPDYALISFKE